MTYEVPQPERTAMPEGQLFIVDAMTDEQLMVLHRGLSTAFDLDVGKFDPSSIYSEGTHLTFANSHPGNQLLRSLVGETRSLGQRDPERLKGLVQTSVTSSLEADQIFGARTVAGLVSTDYEFVRDTLTNLAFGRSEHVTEWVSEWAEVCTLNLISSRSHPLTPEQVAEFDPIAVNAAAHGRRSWK